MVEISLILAADAAVAKSLQSHPILCDPIDGSPLSQGFSRQEHWSGLPFLSPMRESEVAQSCLTLSDPMDCSLPGSSVHGIFQARVLEWVAIAFKNKAYILIPSHYLLVMTVYSKQNLTRETVVTCNDKSYCNVS